MNDDGGTLKLDELAKTYSKAGYDERTTTEEMQRNVEILTQITNMPNDSLLRFYGETCAASILLRERGEIYSSTMAYADAQIAYNEILRRMK